MIIDLNRSIDLRWSLMSGAILILRWSCSFYYIRFGRGTFLGKEYIWNNELEELRFASLRVPQWTAPSLSILCKRTTHFWILKMDSTSQSDVYQGEMRANLEIITQNTSSMAWPWVVSFSHWFNEHWIIAVILGREKNWLQIVHENRGSC